ncbi:hypothetical protein [Thiomicrorhabdus lithotrophica]|uniref:ParB/Sulfiredoxin domain-containing protein n=1 Tax=Thiomicrorhabdus lithotrophica TaxID=2949997 RepID=A0ABY8C7J3_9GAMM|nr:hypothetical protein [Thiomicrorhabdus lithotrophica]WEJ61879.1 hypothetical protein NR989_07610 [Thiomicrorhabdus lithotrophica]
MNPELRTKNIEGLRIEANRIGFQELPWMGELVGFDVYKIPLEYLVYNKYNGRILSRTLSLEQQGHSIDEYSKEGRAKIAELLYKSKKDRNDKTLKSLERFGQEKIGIITKDGIIIDGNRRAMLLSRLKKYDYFKAVILPVTLDENPLEIEKLETSYQMGEDEKLGYNPIEKYLKAKGLYKRLNGEKPYDSKKPNKVAIGKIYDWMGEDESTVIEYLDVVQTMDEYLDYLGYEGIYTQLDGREDQFINLTKWLKAMGGSEPSAKGFDGYKKKDVADLQMIAFDYIRVKYEGKKFRVLAHGRRESHIFGDRNLWIEFRDSHFQKINPILKSEQEIDYNSEDIVSHLNDRDHKFKNNALECLTDNLELYTDKLKNKQESNQPIKLVNRAVQALEAIDKEQEAFSRPDVLGQVGSLIETALSILQEKDLDQLLMEVKNSLKSIHDSGAVEKLSSSKELIVEISRLSEEIRKKLDK